MQPGTGFFSIEEQGETMILTPNADMGELDHDRVAQGMKEIFATLEKSPVKNLVLDFHKTTYYGSTALGSFVRLWKAVCTRKGRMAFCNLSEHETEILEITKLDNLWQICQSRADALKAVGA